MKRDSGKALILKIILGYLAIFFIGSLLTGGFDGLEMGLFIGVLVLGIYGYYYLVFWLIKFFSKLLGKMLGRTEKKIKEISNINLKKYKDYYRDILEINSPLILGYLDNFKIRKSTLVAQLLHMNEKGILIIDDEGIKKNKLSTKKKLSEFEKMIYEKIYDNKLNINNINSFLNDLKKSVHSEAQKLSLIIKTKNSSRIGNFLEKMCERIKNSKSLAMVMMFLLFALAMSNFFYDILGSVNENVELVTSGIMFCSFLGISTIGGLYFYSSVFYKGYKSSEVENPNIRTKKGEELNEALEGLKKYIKDYSLLSQREAEEIVLWEDYLIYSIIFEQNEKVVKEYEKYIG